MPANPGDQCGKSSLVEDAERKQVSVLFSDLAGYTTLSEKLDPEETRQVIVEVFSRAAEIIARHDGRIEKFIGDALMAVFGVPVAHEDDPARALRAALELHAAVAVLSPAIEARSGVSVALHSGVNTGVVVTGNLRFGDGIAGPLGDTINLSARLMGGAPSGEIWVGPETRRITDGMFEFDDLGPQSFKGKTEQVSVARLRGPRLRADTSARSSKGVFVGRQSELDALLGGFETARMRKPRVLAVSGEAGTGKSRLLSEFRDRMGADVQWLEGRAYPYAQNTPFASLIDLLSRRWCIEDSDTPDQVRRKVLLGANAVPDTPAAALPLLYHLFGIKQDVGVVIARESFREELLRTVRALLTGLARLGPVVACLQDLHWIDQSTDSLLRALMEQPIAGVLLIVNFRPGYSVPPQLAVIELAELSTSQTRELLASLLKGDPPEELVEFVAKRSDGNPFYVEEVVSSLVESRVLLHEHDEWRLAQAPAEAGIPSTVRGVIAARIDRLEGERRRVLRHAAVVGRKFLYAVVAQVCDDVDEIAPTLIDLSAADLLRKSRDEPDLEYIFKHSLTQDVAYEGLLKSERQVLHARTARVMETVLASRLSEFTEALAYHYLRGGIVDKAVDYLIESGRKGVERYALSEAAAHFRDAYALVSVHESLPSRARVLTRLLCGWSQVFYYDSAVGEWHDLLERHLEDAEDCGDDALRAMYLGWAGSVRGLHGDMPGALEILDRAQALGLQAGARDAVAHVTGWRSWTLFELGRLADVIACARSLDQSESERRSSPYPSIEVDPLSRTPYREPRRSPQCLQPSRRIRRSFDIRSSSWSAPGGRLRSSRVSSAAPRRRLPTGSAKRPSIEASPWLARTA